MAADQSTRQRAATPSDASDDDPLLSDGEAVLYLGFRNKTQLLDRVAEGRLTPADRRKGRYRFRLSELRRYSRATAGARP